MKSVIAATAILGMLVATPVLAQGQSGNNNGNQEGLVNVNVSGIEVLSGVTSVQVPIGIAAQVCPDIDANVIAEQSRNNQPLDCTVTQETANEAFLNFVQNKK